MNSKLKKGLVATTLAIFLSAGLYGTISIRTFAQQARESRKAAMTQSEKAPSDPAPEVGSSVVDATSTPVMPVATGKIKPEATPVSPAPAETTTTRSALEMVQSTPVINTCSWFEPQKKSMFEKFRIKPKGFEIFVMNRNFELNTLSARLPKNAELLLRQDEELTFVNDLRYAALVYAAKKEVADNLPRAQLVDVRGYFTRVLAQIVLRNPSLVGDPELIATCKSMADLKSPLTRTELINQVQSFLQRAQVRADEINYDPNYVSKIRIDKTNPVNWYYDIPRRTQ